MLMRKTHPLISIVNNALIDLPTPSNISYLWNFGSLLGICLTMQIITGLFLSMHFIGDTSLAFDSVSHISRDVNMGWLIRITHANGASLFFFMVYIHIGRNIYYSTFYNLMVWTSGVIILLLLMATAFLGYVLPWGQMSFWGATVITNLLSAIPYVGAALTNWIWGGFSIDKATLTRFFSLHFLLPFILLAMMVVHLVFLHEAGSHNPLGSPKSLDKIPFHPYFSWKDIFGLIICTLIFNVLIFTSPYLLSDPENFMMANPMITPPHIQPEWYFLFAYAILRSIPNKLGGVLALFLSIIILLSLPFSMKNYFTSMKMYPLNKMMFWWLINNFLLLTYLGACPVEDPYVLISQFMTITYFLWYLLAPLTA